MSSLDGQAPWRHQYCNLREGPQGLCGADTLSLEGTLFVRVQRLVYCSEQWPAKVAFSVTLAAKGRLEPLQIAIMVSAGAEGA